jgi:TPR repeat protein
MKRTGWLKILALGISLMLLASSGISGAVAVKADAVIDPMKFITLSDIYQLIADQKFDQALDRLRPLAAQGNSEAQYALGTMLEAGRGVAQDKSAALKLYQQSADAGYPFAQKKIGLYYYFAKQYDQAFAMLRSLTQMGFRGEVSGALAEMYRHGLGTPVDEAKAECWMRKTVEQVAKSIQSGC